MIVTVLDKYEDGWWKIEVNSENIGLYPSNYLEEIHEVYLNLTKK